MRGRCRWALLLVGVSASGSNPLAVAAPGAVNLPVANSSRELQVAQCIPQLLFLLAAPTMLEYSDCVYKKEASMTMDEKVGYEWAARAECWCKYDVRKTVDEFGCCDDSNWRLMCGITCDADCTTSKAAQCMEECPAICLESDHAPSTCECQDCESEVLCITRADTQCSAQLKEYMNCAKEHPTRTYWQLNNTRHYCYCEVGLSSANAADSCCGESWATEFCEEECAAVDCTSAEATQCAETCRSVCTEIHPTLVTDTCWNTCLTPGTPCEKYKVCKPIDPLEFEYVCADGGKPTDNGCCAVPTESGRFIESCPRMCSERRHYPTENECQCFGCPTSREETNRMMQETILSNLELSGQRALVDIAYRAGLEGSRPTEEMHEMMTRRNAALLQIVADHNGTYGNDLEVLLQKGSRDWNRRVEILAKNQAACQKKPDSSDECARWFGDDGSRLTKAPSPAPSSIDGGTITTSIAVNVATSESSTDSESDSGDATVIIIVVGAIVALILILFILLVVYKLKARPSSSAGSPGDVGPSGEGNVVVGRPVEATGDGGPPKAVAPAAGAPVGGAAKGNSDVK